MRLLLFLGVSCLASCGVSVEGATCGEGTELQGKQCVATLTCGPGTHAEGARCFANTSGLSCGTGTVEQAGVCVAWLSCGGGTEQQGTTCVPVTGLGCGVGTRLEGRWCVPTSLLVCGPGTAQVGEECLPTGTGGGSGAWYEVRFGAEEAPGDGYSKIPVLALGREADGRPATGPATLRLSRVTAGALESPDITLGVFGAVTYFTPCSTAVGATCAGPVTVSLLLPSGSVAAESNLMTIIPPPGVGTTAPCDPYPNALFFDGTGFVFTGTQLVTTGTFSGTYQSIPGTHVGFNVEPASSTQGSWWYADFAAPVGTGPLVEQVYPTAERFPFQAPGAAGLDLSGDGRGCNESSGRFEVHRLLVLNGQLTEFLVTFEQFCENNPANVLRGCLKYTR